MTTWHSVPLGKVVTFQRGYDLPHRVRKQGGVPIVSSAGVTDYHDVPMVNPPGVVTGRYGTIGEIFLVTEPFWPLNTTLYVRDFHGNDECFVYYLLHRFDFHSFSGKSGVPGVNRNDLHVVSVSLPKDIVEQHAIAAALSDVDALLGGLDRLIAKKRDLKQAAMQQLLTGQTRLPGFSGEWEVKLLVNVGPLQRGFDLPNPKLRAGPYPVVYSNGVLKHHAHFQAEGPGVVTGRSGTIGTVTYLEEPYWPHNTALWVTNFNNNDARFVFYLYTRIGFERFASGSGVPTLNRNDVHSFQVVIPPTTAEQSAIAAVLSDMDAELSKLVERRDKTSNLKQAMMQELLTGRIRLV